MNIFITGGAGFIGSNLVRYLAQTACDEYDIQITKIISFDKLTYAGNAANLDCLLDDKRHVFVKGDICDGAHIAETLRKYEIHTMIHLAAETHVDRSIDTPEKFINTNVLGTFQLLNAFKEYKNSLSDEQHKGQMRFLHVSTDEVFGSLDTDDPPFTERTPYRPNSPYSASKAASDHLVRSFYQTYGLPVIITHCSNNYGPFQFPEKLIPLMIQKILKGECLPVYGDGGNIRDWLYVTDHCRGMVCALISGRLGESYVIGGKCEMRNIDLIYSLVSLVHEFVPSSANKSAEELIHFVDDRPGHDKRYAIDPSYIFEELGWQPSETLTSGLRKTVEWYIKNPQWIKNIESNGYQGQRLGTTL